MVALPEVSHPLHSTRRCMLEACYCSQLIIRTESDEQDVHDIEDELDVLQS